jgi:transposase-like protein
VLGIDAGYSRRRKTTGLCSLWWDESSIEWRCEVAGTDEASRLATLEGLGGIGAVARELDLSETAVRRWVQQVEIDSGGGPAGALTTTERISGFRVTEVSFSDLAERPPLNALSVGYSLVRRPCRRARRTSR